VLRRDKTPPQNAAALSTDAFHLQAHHIHTLFQESFIKRSLWAR